VLSSVPGTPRAARPWCEWKRLPDFEPDAHRKQSLCIPKTSAGIPVAENPMIIGAAVLEVLSSRPLGHVVVSRFQTIGVYSLCQGPGEEPEACRARPTRQAEPDAPEIRRPAHPLGQWKEEGKNGARCEASLTPRKAQAGKVRPWRRGESILPGSLLKRP